MLAVGRRPSGGSVGGQRREAAETGIRKARTAKPEGDMNKRFTNWFRHQGGMRRLYVGNCRGCGGLQRMWEAYEAHAATKIILIYIIHSSVNSETCEATRSDGEDRGRSGGRGLI